MVKEVMCLILLELSDSDDGVILTYSPVQNENYTLYITLICDFTNLFDIVQSIRDDTIHSYNITALSSAGSMRVFS
jgi:hypothetical protein